MPTLEAERTGRVLVVRVDNPPHNFMDRGMVAELDALTTAIASGPLGRLGRDHGTAARAVHHPLRRRRDPRRGRGRGGYAGPAGRRGAAGRRPAESAACPACAMPRSARPLRGLLELHRLHDASRWPEQARQGRDRRRSTAPPQEAAASSRSPATCATSPTGRASVIGLPEMTMGFNPGAGGTQRLTRALGPGRALEAMLEGRTFAPSEALAAGIVHRAVEPERLEEEAMETAQRMARRSPGSVRALKAAVYEGASRDAAAGARRGAPPLHVRRGHRAGAAGDGLVRGRGRAPRRPRPGRTPRRSSPGSAARSRTSASPSSRRRRVSARRPGSADASRAVTSGSARGRAVRSRGRRRRACPRSAGSG